MPDLVDPLRNGEPAAGKLSGPFTAPQMIIRPVVGVDDLGRTEGDVRWCKNEFFGQDFPACYRGHEGTDFLLAGHLLAQTAGSIDVYTVAGGTVAAVFDGNTDKCFYMPNKPAAKAGEFIFCANDVRDGKEFISDAQGANFVAIVQDDGIIAYYFHLNTHTVAVADRRGAEKNLHELCRRRIADLRPGASLPQQYLPTRSADERRRMQAARHPAQQDLRRESVVRSGTGMQRRPMQSATAAARLRQWSAMPARIGLRQRPMRPAQALMRMIPGWV